jgi:hypothetical protein
MESGSLGFCQTCEAGTAGKNPERNSALEIRKPKNGKIFTVKQDNKKPKTTKATLTHTMHTSTIRHIH